VGPATVLGLGGGLVGLLVPPAGRILGWLGGCSAWVILAVAEHGARLPGAEMAWPAGPVPMAVLCLLCGVVLVGGRWVMRHRTPTLVSTVLLVVIVVQPVPRPGWPPPGWVVVMCDVGQGDALVVRTGPGEGVVVDVGPEPEPVDDCLAELRVDRVPAVVLSHFHADHVDGLDGALGGRTVGEIQVTALREPASGAALVDRVAAEHGVPVRVPTYGERTTSGEVAWQVVGPRRVLGNSPNDASLVLLVESQGVRILLTGDAEPTEQGQLEDLDIGDVDVLKVPHHGSRYQDHAFLASLRPRVALVSVGADNDYGHPAPDLTSWLERGGVDVRRTDEDGAVAVVVTDGALGVVNE
jgi:competence protein ComEC